jgi:gliding motility-associated-like protein
MPQSHGANPLPYTPQVVAGSSNEMLNDTANWTALTFYYQAQGGEEYIYIGNFNDDNNTSYQTFNANGSVDAAYYYIDDVSLVRVIARDAAINQIEKRDSCFALWAQVQNKGIDSLDFAQEALPYAVEVKQNGNVVQSYSDSIQSNQYNPGGLPLPIDSSIWFPLPALDLANLQGNYQISVELQWTLDEDSTNNKLDSVFNFDLSVGIPKVSTDSLCFGDELQLTTANYKGVIQWQNSLDQMQWQNLMPRDTLEQSPTQKTFYRLAVCDAIFSDTFEVEVVKPNITTLEERQFCSEKEQTISIKKEDSFTTIRWYADNNSNSFFYEGIDLDTTLKTSSTFYLAPVLLGCESKERIPLNITISCEIEIPNVFTPNGDGINDLFVYRNVDESKELQTKIFNRWGDLVSRWDGNKGWKGDGESEGLYFYEIYYGEEKITGVVSLIRD